MENTHQRTFHTLLLVLPKEHLSLQKILLTKGNSGGEHSGVSHQGGDPHITPHTSTHCQTTQACGSVYSHTTNCLCLPDESKYSQGPRTKHLTQNIQLGSSINLNDVYQAAFQLLFCTNYQKIKRKFCSQIHTASWSLEWFEQPLTIRFQIFSQKK